MSQSYLNKVHLIALYIQKGETERSKEEAEASIWSNPEDSAGYVLMAYHYYLLQQNEDALLWMNEAIRRAPEDEDILEMAVKMYEELEDDEQKTRELIETALRLYPDNHFFHAEFAVINQTTDIQQSLASLQEAIRLSPENDEYLGNYAILLHITRNYKEAEKYEQYALQADPENVKNLLHFAESAFERKKYKKAQMLIDQAIRLAPDNERVLDSYRNIYPSKSIFIRMQREMNEWLFKIWLYPSYWISRLLKEKVSTGFLSIIVLFAEAAGLIALLGLNAWIFAGVYIVFLFFCSRLSKSMLKKTGLNGSEMKALKRKTIKKQQEALSEMKKMLAQSQTQPKHEKPVSEPGRLEEQLSQIWGEANISSFKEKPINDQETNGDTLQTKQTSQKDTASPITLDTPEEYSRWPNYLIIAAILVIFFIRFIPGINNTAPASSAKPESLHEYLNQQKQNNESNVKQNKAAVEQFIRSLKEGNIEDVFSQTFSTGYQATIKENRDHPLMKQLAASQIEKVSQSHGGLSYSLFLLVNPNENTKAIVEVLNGKITHLYAESWGQPETEIIDYEQMLKQIERDGTGVNN